MVLGALFFAQPLQDAPPPESVAVEQETLENAAAPEVSKSFDLNRLKMAQCGGERFEFAAGEATKVKLCSNAGATKEEVAVMLESAIAKLEASDRIRAESRDAIVAQIRARLDEVRAR
jgi:Holliday junction resolvasome RuvABC endonuclease subunit